MGENARFWIAFVLSALGALLLALLTLDPQESIGNLRGWVTLVLPTQPNASDAETRDAISVVLTIISLVVAIISVLLIWWLQQLRIQRRWAEEEALARYDPAADD